MQGWNVREQIFAKFLPGSWTDEQRDDAPNLHKKRGSIDHLAPWRGNVEAACSVRRQRWRTEDGLQVDELIDGWMGGWIGSLKKIRSIELQRWK